MSGILQLVNTFSSSSGPFAVQNSLRFRASASAYLSRTITLSATWTLSVWVKRGSLGVTSPIFGGSVLFNSNDTLTAGTLTTTAVYRDPSAWYHIIVSNSGCYVNGASVGSTATGILVSPLIGSNAVNYFDGYLAEINLIDGQALTPSSFGANDPTSGVWKPVKYSGTYGTNGFYLNFINGTSTTTLGYDASGNGNNWTTNNISLTAGSTYDWMLDSPTNYANGGNGVGNYAVLNAVASDGTTSNANLTVAWVGGNSAKPSTIGMSTGKWYCEIYMDSVGTAALPGLIPSTMVPTAGYPGSSSGGYGYYYDGQKYSGGAGSVYGASYTNGDIIGIAFDADAGTLTFYKNGTSQGVAFSSIASGTWFFAAGHSGTTTMSPNFGQRPFAYTPPTGFNALNTQNLPAASIVNGAAYMAATTYTGNGSTQSISNAVNGTSFQPDFVWIKERSTASAHALYDSIRGNANVLSSNNTGAEYAQSPTAGLNSFSSGGFSVTYPNTGDYYINRSGQPNVTWQWKANGTAVSNTAGSITSQVSANTTAGFSVVTYTGNGVTGATVGHGLGVKPALIIAKYRGGVSSWPVYHQSLGANYWLLLNSTNAATNSSQEWNNTEPTSSVFSIGNSSANDNQSGPNVAYCFAAIAGYSAFGSYTGNGSASGPFVYCGFRPRYVLVKASSTTGDWCVLDTSRSPYNLSAAELYPNLANAEGTGTNFEADIVSNGFVLRGTGADSNGSGVTYIYAAFAENPLKYSLAR
jgi:SPRY domain